MTSTTDPTLAEAEARLEALRDEYAALSAKINDAYETVQILRMQQTADLLTGRAPAEFWTDSDLRAHVMQRDWSGGMGDRQSSEFITAAIRDLNADDFYEYDRMVSRDYRTVLTIKPRIKMTYQQDVQAARQALLTMLPALRLTAETVAEYLADSPVDLVDAMRCDVFEHTLSAGGTSYDLLVYSDDKAVVLSRGYATFEGTLTEALTYIAKHHWYEGGPVDESCYACGSSCYC